jgi:transcriptional regulator with XRE-family HTH domain
LESTTLSNETISRKSRATGRRASQEDVAIARRVRALRLERGLSQDALARQTGVSFQQFQKYEKGDNRISAGRLQRIAQALNVSVTVFYGNTRTGPDERSFAYLRTRGALRLVRAYAGIPAPRWRTALVALAEALARDTATKPS